MDREEGGNDLFKIWIQIEWGKMIQKWEDLVSLYIVKQGHLVSYCPVIKFFHLTYIYSHTTPDRVLTG